MGLDQNASGYRAKAMGEWVDKEVAWYDQSMTYCACCGLVIPKGYWQAEVQGEALIFCKPDCERLYREHRLPESAETGAA